VQRKLPAWFGGGEHGKGPVHGTSPCSLSCAVVVNGDLDDYMNYYKTRYREDVHLLRYDPASIPDLGLTA
jgi:hypothetical protein